MLKSASSPAALLVIASICLVAQVGCASFNRSRASGYSGGEKGTGQQTDRFSSTAREMGFGDTNHLSDGEQESVDSRLRVENAERTLETKRDREQYFKNKPYMSNDSERLAFLALPSFEERGRWLNSHGIKGGATPHPPQMKEIIEANDIALGMTKQAVRDAWGPPEAMDVAGNPLYGNERWYYREQTTSTEGYRGEKCYVYFESGLVVGWDRQKE